MSNLTSTKIPTNRRLHWEAISAKPIFIHEARTSQGKDGYPIAQYGFWDFIYYGINTKGWHIARWHSRSQPR